ncbi:MAG: hypothetical protein IPM69_11510 [Ignavibacteria bacterium]|nr:hypothetical protein [Ignavibacteria bacterium]
MKRFYNILLAFCVVTLYFVACSSSTDPDSNPGVIGGETNIELSKVGNYFSVIIVTDPQTDFNFSENNTTITKNDNGIVTFYHKSAFDSTFIESLANALGLQDLPDHLILPALVDYAKRIGGKLDTTDKERMTLTAEFTVKITSEGMQEYFGKNNNLTTPHTLVKYAWNVGNVYEFTNTEEIKVKRTVVAKSTTDDYSLSHLKLKVIKVEETKEDPIIDKITYIANHKYGLIGIILKSKTGKEVKLTVFPTSLF